MNLIDKLTELDNQDELHIARLLLLMKSLESQGGQIDSLTKLAKLDFLLRYPVYLERALSAVGYPATAVKTRTYERMSVESAMVRYRYGPWDFRYRRLLNIMAAKNLIVVEARGKALAMTLTETGKSKAESLAELDQFLDIVQRSQLLRVHFDKSGHWLMEFIYAKFPEILTLTSGKHIQ